MLKTSCADTSDAAAAPRSVALARHRRRGYAALSLAALLLVTACADGDEATEKGTDDGQTAEQGESAQGESAQGERDDADDDGAEVEAALAGPSAEHRDEAEELVAQMSPEQKAGQVLVGEYSGTDASQMAGLIEELHLAGAIVMGDNVPTEGSEADLEALASQIETMQEAASDRSYPAIISVDQEGGLVTRIGEPLTEWPTPMAYGAAAQGGHDDAVATAQQGHTAMGRELAELGFTVDFAPNGDVTVGSADPTMGSRAFGADPEMVTELSMAGLRGLSEAGVAGSMKHFPGHGSVEDDSHHTLPVQDKSLEQLWDEDWLPFREAGEEGAPMVMVGHLEVPALEEGVPSSLSSATYSQLRGTGFDGVAVTDALNMGAIVQQYGADEAPVQALDAGADLLLMPSDIRGAHEAILAALGNGELEEQRLDQAAQRVVAMMLWQQDLAAGELAGGPRSGAGSDVGPDAGSDAGSDAGEQDETGAVAPDQRSLGVSRDAVTLVEGECGAVLVGDEADDEQAATGIEIIGGDEEDRARLTEAAEAAGADVGAGGVQVHLFSGAQGSAGGDVAVALERPEALAGADAPVQIALYGDTPGSFEALIEVLEGREAPGALPTAVGEHEVGHSRCAE